MDLGLKGKNAIVIGGTRGIGRAIAATLAGEGANVAVCARNADQVAATVTELKASGINATGSPVDVTDGTALKGWIEAAAKELGGLDMLFSKPARWRKAAIPRRGSRISGSTFSAPCTRSMPHDCSSKPAARATAMRLS